ncbi:MAG: 3-isopropylmalate dehydratase small subunit [SAR324 cluster bacterium]|nr:3-isopropylmalate dehydratase small subunit [SAR324 cluster bacterium]
MEPLTVHQGIAALLDRTNVDTDQIIPKQFLKRVNRSGYGAFLFYDWRFLENGDDNPDFELNNSAFKGASILVAGDNFGCGSSREHAPWSLLDYGFRVVISTSFADIFYNNCLKNGILPAIVEAADLSGLMAEIRENEGVQFKVDLAAQQVSTPKGSIIRFEVDQFRKECLLGGLDDIAWTMQHEAEIIGFEEKQRSAEPWLWSS